MNMIKDIISMMKIKHYIKNCVVFVPVLLSMQFLKFELYPNCLIIFLSFCFISSAVYILNDLFDIEKDKLHPTKSKRAIASGRITKKTAILSFLILLILSFSLVLFLNIPSFLCILSYLVLNILYSAYFKKIAIVDVFCIALGFILRIISGCFAIGVLPSPLIILMTMFVSMFFTFSKRKLELKYVKDKNLYRESIKDFNENMVNQFILFNAVLSVSFYITYVLDKTTIQRAGCEYLYITTIPFVPVILRLLFLVNSDKTDDDPMRFIEKDVPIRILFLLYILILVIPATI